MLVGTGRASASPAHEHPCSRGDMVSGLFGFGWSFSLENLFLLSQVLMEHACVACYRNKIIEKDFLTSAHSRVIKKKKKMQRNFAASVHYIFIGILISSEQGFRFSWKELMWHVHKSMFPNCRGFHGLSQT